MIYDASVLGDLELRDKLLKDFVMSVETDLLNHDHFDLNIKVQTQQGYGLDTDIPKLLIHSPVVNIKDVSRLLVFLREYFEIEGGLRLTNRPYYLDNDGELGYFPHDEHNLTLLLDFVEYKCNNIYKESKFKKR